MGVRVLLALFVAAMPLAAVAEGERVRLSLANETGAALRCQFLLAHWMTSESWVLAPGDRLALTLGRTQEGVLFQSHAEEPRPFPVEALLCGRDAAFADTRRALDLSALRVGASRALHLVCVATGSLICRTKPP